MKEDQRFYQERIVADPRILVGKPVVKGTRIGVDLVLEELSHNPDIHELLAAHPQQFPPIAPIFYVTMMSEQSADDLTSI